MITMIILLWIAASLKAPVWIYILGGLYLVGKVFSSLIKLCKEAIKWQEQ